MIISASRRTDIPAFFSEWMIERIHEGYVEVKNPMNPQQIRRIELSPEKVDCIVFWSKNPRPLLDHLEALQDYAFYVQFTLNPYDSDMEPHVPRKEEIIETFKRLSDLIGPQRVLWRYDPVILNDVYPITYHIDHFSDLAAALKQYTESVTFSYIDYYRKIDRNWKTHGLSEISIEDKETIAENFSRSASENKLRISACAESIDLSKYNIEPGRCIDDRVISKITGKALELSKDKGQRPACGCVNSIDIGTYNTCRHGCVYCYASYGKIDNQK